MKSEESARSKPYTRIKIRPNSKEVWTVTISANAREETWLTHEYTVPSMQRDQDFDSERTAMAYLPSKAAGTYLQYQDRLETFGRELYSHLSASVGSEWERIIESGNGPYEFDLAPELQCLPWEILFHDTHDYLDTSTRPIVRKLDTIRGDLDFAQSKNPSFCFVGADVISHPTRAPEQKSQILTHLPNSMKQLQGSLLDVSSDPSRDQSQWESLSEVLRKHQPTILHIVAHGADSLGFYLEASNRHQEELVEYGNLLQLLDETKSVRLLFLAICKSGTFFLTQSHLIDRVLRQTHLDAIIAMATDISAEGLIKLTRQFYGELGRGREVSRALGVSRFMLRSPKNPIFSLQWSVPMLYERESFNPFEGLFDGSPAGGKVMPFPAEYLEEAGDAIKQIETGINDLVDLQKQVDPSKSHIVDTASEIGTAARYFTEALAMFDQHYESQYEKLLNTIRAESSYFVPKLQRVVNEAKRDTKIRSGPSAIVELLRNCQKLNSQMERLQHL